MRKRWGVKAEVVHSPCRVDFGKVVKKRAIVAVGRFDPRLKKQDVLVNNFVALCDSGLEGWELILVGGLNTTSLEDGFEAECHRFVERLKALSAGYPVRFLINASGAEVRHALETSSLFWHGTGLDQSDPGLTEHFGIVTVEAMAAGCVPLVFGGGGQPEIVRDGVDGYIWKDPGQLVAYTKSLILDPDRLKIMSEKARGNVQRFSKEAFRARLLEVMSSLLK